MIVFCGYANNDVTVHVPHVPVLGERVQASTIVSIDGGMNANAAVSAARMGAEVKFAGAVGPDARSSEFLGALAGDGVDVEWAPRDAFLSTAVVLIAADGDRSIISQDDANDASRIAAVVDRLHHAGGGILFLDGYRAAMLPARLPDNVRLAIDLDGCEDRNAALRAFELADHVIVGRPLWEQDFGIGADTWPLLAARHDVHLVVTDGARGWTLVTPAGLVATEPAVQVDVIDAVGAGDCFCGTYIAFVDAGRSALDAARLAGASAGLACATAGPRGCPSIEELTRFTESLTTLDLQEIP